MSDTYHTSTKIARWAASILLAIFLLPLKVVSANQEHLCTLPLERHLIDALINHDFQTAEQFLPDISTDNSLIGYPPFYAALIDWSKAVYEEDSNKRSTAISELDRSASHLQKIYQEQKDTPSLLALGLATAHIARVHFHNDQYISGYRLGKRALDYLEQYLKRPDTSPDGIAASRLIFGLKQIYLTVVPDEMRYLAGFSEKPGSLDQGRKLIKQVITTSPHYASEAARALLMETPWGKPDICSFAHLFEQMRQRYSRNLDIAILLQGLYLRCGQPKRSLEINTDTYNQSGKEEHREIMIKGLYRGLADTAQIASLNRAFHSQELEPYRLLALANALDLNKQRHKALVTYRTILSSADIPQSILRSAKLRLNYPYFKATYIASDNSLSLLSCSQ